MSAPRPLVFLHIPKTSGIAVAHAMVETIGAANVFFGFDRAFFGGFSAWESIPAESRAFIHFSPATLPADALVVRAHMSLSTLRAAYPTGRFMTVLREPVCRLLSHYVFWRGFTPGQHASWGGWGELSALARRPLEAFLADPRIACQIDNVATRLLLWPHALIPPDGPIDPAHDAALIAAAIAALDSLDFADASENPSFEANLGAWLGTSPRRARRNESAPMPAELRLLLDAALTPAATTLIAARTRLDVMLWHAVLARRAPGLDAAALRQAALLHGTARAAALLAG